MTSFLCHFSLQFVGSAIATDPDQPFAESGVTYLIDPSSNPDGAFHIDKNNGSITAVKPIDRETSDQIRLKILVSCSIMCELYSLIMFRPLT